MSLFYLILIIDKKVRVFNFFFFFKILDYKIILVSEMKSLNLNFLLENIDNDKELLRELINDFIVETTHALKLIEKFIKNKNFDSLSMEAHKLKGLVGHFDQKDLLKACCAFSDFCKEKNEGKITVYFNQISKELQEAILFLKTQLN